MPVCTSQSTPRIAERIASATRASLSAVIAKIVGPDPLIEQPSAPASSAACLTARKFGIRSARIGSA